MPIKPGAALLFDIDGTLVDSDPLHLRAFNKVFEPYGHTFDKDRFDRELHGLANVEIGARLLSGQTPERQLEILMEKEARFRELAAKGVDPVPGLLDLMDWADDHGVPMIAVTNAPRLNAEQLLDAVNVRHRVRDVVIGDELARGKPHPLPYLEGLRRLGANPANSVAFEDSRTGIASATGAGITTVGMATGLAPEHLMAAGATLGARDYTDARLFHLVESRVLA
jgi:HAD superfamily hydrolase (TIGR01509 family)